MSILLKGEPVRDGSALLHYKNLVIITFVFRSNRRTLLYSSSILLSLATCPIQDNVLLSGCIIY